MTVVASACLEPHARLKNVKTGKKNRLRKSGVIEPEEVYIQQDEPVSEGEPQRQEWPNLSVMWISGHGDPTGLREDGGAHIFHLDAIPQQALTVGL